MEHQGSQFIILSNGGGKYLNYRLCACPLNSTEQAHWKEVLPYDPMKHLMEALPFKDFLLIYECSDALKHFRIIPRNSQGELSASDAYYMGVDEELYFIEPSSVTISPMIPTGIRPASFRRSTAASV